MDWRKKDIWIELTVESNIMSPREKIMSQFYSLHSYSAENLSADVEIIVETSTKSAKAKIGVNEAGELYSKSAAAGNTEFYMVPKGGIILWSGSASDIPLGWALCDGQNATPDLRGRFVLGYGTTGDNAPNSSNFSYNANKSKGGEVNHTLSVSEMPSHLHYLFSPQNKKQGTAIASSKNSSVRYSDIGGTREAEYVMMSADDGSLADSGVSSSIGGNTDHNNMPPYYVLCYIMKK